jgi:branched-chain amino acid transport system ATP-binding protein
VLEVERIRVSYGAAPAISGVSIRVGAGELVCVVGPNGAGKTTLINAIAGLHPIEAGALRLDGRDLSRLPRHAFCGEGIAVVPEGRRLFAGMSVRENLELGSYRRAARARHAESLERVCDVFPILRERLEQPAGTLSGGEQQMLATGRALVTNPDLLLMDEPTEGLAPLIVRELGHIITDLRAEGISILLVEQNLGFALDLADHVYVLSKGTIVHACTPAELMANDEIKARYLGV